MSAPKYGNEPAANTMKLPRKLNLGCGFDLREGHLNVDFQDFHKPDMLGDVRSLPTLPSGYFEEIVAQDVLEHLPRLDTPVALSEWNRLLRIGGLLHIRAPNIVGLAELCVQPERQSIEDQKLLVQCLFGTQAYNGDWHLTGFTEKLLRYYLVEAGFEVVKLTSRDHWLFETTARKTRELVRAAPQESKTVQFDTGNPLLRPYIGPAEVSSVGLATDPQTPYVCISCRGSRLARIEGAYVCQTCRSTFPVVQAVPIFVDGVIIERTEPTTSIDDDVRHVLEYFRLPFSPENVNRLREIFCHRYVFRQQHYTAENNSFMARICKTQPEKWNPGRVSEYPQATVTHDYIPEELLAGASSTHNVRIRNDDNAYLMSVDVPKPILISHHWFMLDGRISMWDGPRTRFPIPVSPHRAVTVPVSIAAPLEPGDYLLRLDLVRESIGWGGLEPWEKVVRVTRAGFDSRSPDWVLSREVRNYEQDHDYARTLLQKWVSGLGPEARILELGGTSSPQTPWFGLPVWNVDIDVQSLQIGALHHSHNPNSACTFVCADAYQLPFEPAYFDCIAMFATLHHFEEPEALLRSVSRHLKTDGFIAVLCDPVGHDVAGADYRRDLNAGINEQTFTPAEYSMIFDRAGLYVLHAQIDDSSLKAFLGTRPRVP
jgi:ubiquinone/menaquinone biosynthesis C-methylase UbiE